MGQLTLIVGPMFSGKTSEMQQRIKDAVIGLRKAIVLMPQKDTRYHDRKALVTSHDGISMIAIRVSRLEDAIPLIPKDPNTIIGIDEGQFFTDLDSFCKKYMDLGNEIVVAALSSDADCQNWKAIVDLYPLATDIVFRHGTCILCQQPSSRSRRIVQTPPPQEQIQIGGDETYVSTCDACFKVPISQDILEQRASAVAKAREMFHKNGETLS